MGGSSITVGDSKVVENKNDSITSLRQENAKLRHQIRHMEERLNPLFQSNQVSIILSRSI